VAFFALTECALPDIESEIAYMQDFRQKEAGGSRSTVLSFATGLCGCHIIVIVAVASPPIRIIVQIPSIVHLVILRHIVADRGLVLRQRGGWFRRYWQTICIVVLVKGLEVLVVVHILLWGQERLGVGLIIMKFTNGWRVAELV